MLRLFWKLFFSLWLSILAFMLLLALTNAHLVRNYLDEAPEAALRRHAARLEEQLGQALLESGEQGLQERLQQLPRQLRYQVFVLDEQGRDLLGREFGAHRLENPQHPPARHSRHVLRDASGRAYQLLVLRPPPPSRMLEPGGRGVLHRLMAAALVSALVSLFLARQLARPLEELGRASRQLATGDLSARVGEPLISRRDEFGVLARELDQMAMRLQDLQGASRTLLRDVSHELRSPLARMRVALALIRQRGEPGSQELARIEQESERLEDLVDQILGLLRESSESAPLRAEHFDLRPLLEDLVECLAFEAGPDGPGIRLEAAAELPLNAERESLWRALENLLRNALVHGRGEIVLSAAAREPGGNLEIRVRDSGQGLPEHQLGQVFEPFFRGDAARSNRPGSGHGLGLAIAAATARRHGGQISARNLPGGGFEVLLSLPSHT